MRSRCLIIAVVLMLALLGQLTNSANAATLKPARRVPALEKGVAIANAYVMGVLSGAPSFSMLKQAKFTLVGTIATQTWDSNAWNTAKKWVQSAHAAGFQVFVDLDLTYPKLASDITVAAQLTKSAVSAGFDIVALDELLADFNPTRDQLVSIIEAGLGVNPTLRFFLNEYTPDLVKTVYEWTASYPTVQIATDDYNRLSTIDLGIQLANQYGKKPLVWLLSTIGSQSFDCYNNFEQWVAYVQPLQVGALFWYIDGDGAWQTNWNSVVNFRG